MENDNKALKVLLAIDLLANCNPEEFEEATDKRDTRLREIVKLCQAYESASGPMWSYVKTNRR